MSELATDGPRRPRWGRRIAAVLVVVLISSAFWAKPVFRRLAFFNVRHVEVRGARFASAADIAGRLQIDTSYSIWNDPEPLAARVRLHPQVAEVRISRRLPSTLIVTITEHDPVAFTPTAGGLRAYDAEGRTLPLDPSRSPVDLPIIPARDTSLLRLLGELKEQLPKLFARVSEARRSGRDELVMDLVSPLNRTIPVRMMTDISVERLAQISLVESDLLLRRARVHELDLRFRDQVIARLQ